MENILGYKNKPSLFYFSFFFDILILGCSSNFGYSVRKNISLICVSAIKWITTPKLIQPFWQYFILFFNFWNQWWHWVEQKKQNKTHCSVFSPRKGQPSVQNGYYSVFHICFCLFFPQKGISQVINLKRMKNAAFQISCAHYKHSPSIFYLNSPISNNK